uniref:Uncharacterized protein n=1 Tax=Timema shepardi TaxID=629360 RepID=A0A7R9B0T8_TIMSH|nr:unnamed protein product [Timema shepardi]
MVIRGHVHGSGGSDVSSLTFFLLKVRHPVHGGSVSDGPSFTVVVFFDAAQNAKSEQMEQSREGDKHRNIERRNMDEGGQKEEITREIYLQGTGGTSFLGSPLKSLDVEWIDSLCSWYSIFLTKQATTISKSSHAAIVPLVFYSLLLKNVTDVPQKCHNFSSPMASLVLADGFEKLPDQIRNPYTEPYDLQKHVLNLKKMVKTIINILKQHEH